MTLKQKKLKVELMKVEAAKGEMELKILERQEDISRIEESIKIQEKRIKEIEKELGGK